MGYSDHGENSQICAWLFSLFGWTYIADVGEVFTSGCIFPPSNWEFCIENWLIIGKVSPLLTRWIGAKLTPTVDISGKTGFPVFLSFLPKDCQFLALSCAPWRGRFPVELDGRQCNCVQWWVARIPAFRTGLPASTCALDRWWAAGMAGSYGPNPLKNCLYSWDSPFVDRNVPQCGIRYMVYSCNPVWSSTNTGFEHCSCRVEAAKDGEWTVENEGIPILGRVVFSTIVFVATNGGCVFMYIYIYTHLYIHTYIYIHTLISQRMQGSYSQIG